MIKMSWFQNLTNSTYIPNSTIDSLVIDRVVELNLINMGILCVIIAILSVIIFYIVMCYLKSVPKSQ
jgi:hypothetical protein